MKKILMTLALLCAVAQGTWAEDVSYIYYTLIDVGGTNVSVHGNTGTAKDPTVLTSTLLEKSDDDNLNSGWYVLNSTFTYGERIVISGDVHLILSDGCTLTALKGIRINTDASLTIYAQSVVKETMGKIVAQIAEHDKAAIGGNKNYEAGRLIIHGGEIEATCKDGSKYAAGIGGGYGDDSGMKEITIYQGRVTAQGAEDAAGIGGGRNNNHPCTINIYNGYVKATGGIAGAGIGGGANRGDWPVNIYGGTVEAKGKGKNYGLQIYGAAGIGGGDSGSQTGRINIYDGTVTATGEYGAGIGGGYKGVGGEVYIYNGTVTAKAGEHAAGIGGGYHRAGGDIHISGGTVTAENLDYGAAIGDGSRSEGCTIEITGGHVTTKTCKSCGDGKAACNIGCGSGKEKQNITLGKNMCVKPQSGMVVANDRLEACKGPRPSFSFSEEWWTVEVYECEHLKLTYSDVNASNHTVHCKNCEYTKTEVHSTVAPSTTCEKCGYVDGATICTLSFYQTATASTSDYLTSGTPYVKGQTIAMPSCTQVPGGMTFVGWLKQGDNPASIETADGETLLQPGDDYTVDGSETFYARYRYVFTTTWQWWIGGGDQVAVSFKDGTPQLIYATVTSQTVDATATTPGYTVYTATATYKRDNTTYTFTDEQTVVNHTTVELELDETDNTVKLETNNGLEANVTLTGRTLYKDGKWNTLCLPFDVALEGSVLKGATVKEMTDASFDSKSGKLTLTFADAADIKAGQAYLIKWADSGTALSPSDLVFNGVTLNNYLNDDEISVDDSGTATVTFMGTYKKLSFDADDRTVLFLGADNKLYYPQGSASIDEQRASIGAQRAYFKLSGITAGDKSTGANTFVLDFGDGDNTTGIIEAEANSSFFILHSSFKEGWYTLDGRRLSGKPAQKGIYINNGKKNVIK